MTRDFLKNLELSEEQIDKIFAEFGKNITAYKQDIESKDTKIKELNAELTKYSDYDEKSQYQAKYEELTNKYNTDMNKAKLDSIITEKLYQNKAKNVSLLRKSINVEDIKMDEKGNFIGIDEQINSLKESDGYLFGSEKDLIPSAAKVGLDNNEGKTIEDPVVTEFLKRNPKIKEENLKL